MAVLAYRGDLRHLACDAWYLPGDFEPYIAEYWLDGDRDLEQAVAAAENHLPENWNSGGTRVVPLRLTDTRRATPILAAIPNRGTSTWSYHRETLRQFTELAATLPRPKHMERRPRRLFGVPLIGTGRSSWQADKAKLVQGLLDALIEESNDHEVDFALVIHDEVDWAATQAVRRQRLGNVADDPEVGDLAPVIEDLAEKARAGRLVLFTGAGISIPAGLPDWRGLLAELATDVVSDDAQAERLAKMDVLDQAAVVASRIGQAELVGRVVRSVSAPHHAPAHGLLASLGVRENVTLNYDELFEMAAGDAGSPVAVLPYEPAEDRWLLKLHGCASKERQRDIVLTRSDYLSLGQHRATLTGLIQALLVTRHMLFVGFGLADDHFHAVVHDVRRSLGDGARGRFGTALVLERDELLGELWGKDLRLVPMDADSTAEAARKLELVLDRLLLLTTTSDRHLFDPAFEGLLSEDERDLRDRLLVTFGHHRIGQGSSWQRVERVLADLGWKGRAR